jgi:putative ABC transport system permease protein
MVTWKPMRLVFAVFILLVFAPISSTSPDTQPTADLPDIAVSERTARRLGIAVGDVIEVSTEPPTSAPGKVDGKQPAPILRVRVAAVWQTREHPTDVARGDLLVRFHLPVLESLLGREDAVDRIVVRLRDPSGAAHLRDDLNALAPGYDAYTAGELAQHTSRTFLVISRFHRAIGLITLLASGIFLVTIMSLKLTEMRREIGALRLIGIGRKTIALAVMLIAAAVSLAGTLIGLGLGALLAWSINAYYQPLFDTALRFAVVAPGTVLFAGSLAVVLGFGAGAVVAYRLLTRHPLEQVGR